MRLPTYLRTMDHTRTSRLVWQTGIESVFMLTVWSKWYYWKNLVRRNSDPKLLLSLDPVQHRIGEGSVISGASARRCVVYMEVDRIQASLDIAIQLLRLMRCWSYPCHPNVEILDMPEIISFHSRCTCPFETLTSGVLYHMNPS